MAFTVGFMVPTPVIVALQVAQRVSNLEVTIIARLWPNAWTGCS